MSEEQAEESSQTSEASSENVSHETIQTEPQAESKPVNTGKPAGYYPVDPEKASPEEVQNRIDYLYRQVKEQGKYLNEQGKYLNEYKTVAQQQSERINELTNGVVRVVDHLQTKQTAETENEIRHKMQAAWESGDNKAYHAEQEKLTTLKVQQGIQQAQKPKNETQQLAYAGVKSASQLAQDASRVGEIGPQETIIVNAWQDESDERGQPLRPWAKTEDPSDPDPDYVKALTIAAKVWKENPHRTIQENLAEVDRKMGVRKSASGQTVMGGSLTTPAKKQNIRLSPDIEKVAMRMKFAGPKASDAEHIAAYRKQIEETRSSQGRR